MIKQIILLCCLLGVYAQAGAYSNIDSLKTLYYGAKAEGRKAQLAFDIGKVYFTSNTHDSTYKYHLSAWSYYKNQPIDTTIDLLKYQLAETYRLLSMVDESLILYKSILTETKLKIEPWYLCSSRIAVAGILQIQSKIAERLKLLLEIEPYLPNSPKLYPAFYYNLAILYGMDGNREKVKKYLEIGLTYVEPTNLQYLGAYSKSLGVVYSNANNLEKALYYFDKSYNIALVLNSYENACFSLGNAISMEGQLKRYKRAIIRLDTLKLIANKLNNNKVKLTVYELISFILRDQKKYSKARLFLDSAITLAKLNNLLSGLPAILSVKAELDYILGDHKEAMITLRRLQDVKDSMFNYKKYIAVQEAVVKFDTKLKEKQVEHLTQTVKDQDNLTFIIIGMATVMLGGVGFVFFKYRKVQKSKQAVLREHVVTTNFEHAKERAESLGKNAELESITKVEQERKAAAYRELIATNAIMASLQDVLTKTQSALRENPNLSRKLELLLEKLDDKTDSEENWEKYKILFAQIRPDFFARLNDIGTDINAHDERLAAYLLMGLTSKQISKLLDIGAPTLHNRRSKLRKKLGLDTAQDLADYLEQI